jgi:group I intron endonuclease
MVIYKTTNLVNGKQYIGKDGHNNPNYIGSGSILKKAIKKYGRDNFKKEIIEVCDSKEHLLIREKYWLDYYDVANNPMFYNLHNHSYGSAPGDRSPRFGKKISEEHRMKLKKYMTGKKLSEKTIQKLRELNLGENNPNYGKHPSDETRKKLSECRRGEKNPFYGKRHSEETRQKIKDGLAASNKTPYLKGYVVCVSGQYKGQRKTSKEWCELLHIECSNFSSHLSGKKYTNGIKGNFFKWEYEL